MNGLPSTPPILKATLVVSAVVLVVLGSGLTFATHLMAVLYGTPESPSGSNAARTAGAAIIALGALAWIGRKQDMTVIRALVVPVLFVWFVLKSIAAYSAIIDGIFKVPVGRTVFISDVLLAIIYGYYFVVTRYDRT
jgi:hypothetical protein